MTDPPMTSDDPFLAEHTAAIHRLARRSAEDIIDIGTRLTAVKGYLDHGQFLPWLNNEFGWSIRTAQRLLSVAEAFAGMRHGVAFEAKALYALAAGDVLDVTRQGFIDRAEAGETIRYRDVRDAVESPKRRPSTSKRATDSVTPVKKEGPNPLAAAWGAPVKFDHSAWFVPDTIDHAAWFAGRDADPEASRQRARPSPVEASRLPEPGANVVADHPATRHPLAAMVLGNRYRLARDSIDELIRDLDPAAVVAALATDEFVGDAAFTSRVRHWLDALDAGRNADSRRRVPRTDAD